MLKIFETPFTIFSQKNRRKLEFLEKKSWNFVYILAVEKTNFLVRKLKATGKDESAQAAFDKLPDNAGDAIVQLEMMDDRQRLIVREYLSWSAYFVGKTAFDRWFTHYNKERPHEPKGQTSQHLTHKVTLEKQVQQVILTFSFYFKISSKKSLFFFTVPDPYGAMEGYSRSFSSRSPR